jgi:histidinol-phosphate aminotransferase
VAGCCCPEPGATTVAAAADPGSTIVPVTAPTTPPSPRAAVAALPAYVAGKPPAVQAGQRAFKLSSNENPFPPLPGVLEAVEQAARSLNRYPDMGNTALYEALAERLGVETGQLAAGTGSVALLYHLFSAFCEPGEEVVHAWRSFEAYPIAITASGAVPVAVPLDAGGRHDLEAMLEAITERTKVVVVCTPNNPTGPAVPHADLAGFLGRVPARVLVVVDEAYREFVRVADPVDGLALVAGAANVVTMRTFAKASGLAGLRVGYLVAHPEVAAAVRACSLPFGVSSIAQAAAVASLAAEDELLARVATIVERRDAVVASLRDQGWTIPDAQGNFVWLPLGDLSGEFAAQAQQAGISVRPFAGDGVRVSIGEPEADEVFLRVAQAWRAGREDETGRGQNG